MNLEARSQNSESDRVVSPRTPAKSFKELIVWQKAHQFVLGIYRFTNGFPGKETCGLSSQLRRAAVSIPANIAEGFKKRGQVDKVRFLDIAQGSLEECRYYLTLAKDVNYGDTGKLNLQVQEVGKLLEGYSAKILASGF